MNVNKSNLFENKSLFLSHVNEILSANNIDLTVQEPHNVTAGRGYSKTLVNIDICKKGQWVAIFTYDMSDYSLKRTNTLGRYSKAQTDDIISEAYAACKAILSGFHELDGTNEIKRQQEQKAAEKQQYIDDLKSEIHFNFLHNEDLMNQVSNVQYYNEFVSKHGIEDQDIKECIFFYIKRKYKRAGKEFTDAMTSEQVNTKEEKALTTNTPEQAWELLKNGYTVLMNNNELDSLSEYVDTLSDEEYKIFKHFSSVYDKSLACGILTRTYICKLKNYSHIKNTSEAANKNNQTTEQKEEYTTVQTSYTVGNRSFTSHSEALEYCNACDFDPEIMIIEEVATQQPSQTKLDQATQTNKPAEPVKYYFYKQTFNNYMDAYNHALTNMSPVTMILPSNHSYMTNERLQQLEYSYTFEKSKMPYKDMKEYFQYISSLELSSDQQERYYKLKSYIDRYEYKQQSKQAEKDRLNNLMKESCIMLHFMKSKGLTIDSSHDSGISYVKYIYNNQTIDSYITSAGIDIEKYHAMIKDMLEKHFTAYLNEYNNFTIYLYRGSYEYLEDMQTIQGYIYNENKPDTTLYAFDKPLNDVQVQYYSLVPYGQNTALQAV